MRSRMGMTRWTNLIIIRRQPGQHLVQQHAQCPPVHAFPIRSHPLAFPPRPSVERETHVYPCPCNNSGAKYSGVPQNVFVVSESVMFNLHNPKSHNAMWPV